MYSMVPFSRLVVSRPWWKIVLALWFWGLGVGQTVTGPAWAARTQGIPGGGAPQLVQWGLYPESCPSPNTGTVVACGDYGTFVFGGSTTGCADVTGSESPPIYVAPGPHVTQVPGGPIPRSLGGTPPCLDGACFEAPGGSHGNEPWIAVIDWNTRHGWTTGWAAISLSGLPASLFALDGEDLASLGSGVNDAHLLARLCEVAEAVDRQGIAAPTVVSMSLGRYFSADSDAVSQSTCDPASLSCQIGGVIDHLANAGAVSVAAAGNYGNAQFPAVYDTVLATGSLDLAHLNWTKEVVATWETPDTAEVLLPGYGLCLEKTDGEGRTELWPAPPGSSYASSVFAGWLAHTLLARPVLDPLSTPWELSWSETEHCFVLSEEGPPACNLAADRLLARALGVAMDTCWTSSPHTYVEVDSLAASAQQGVTHQIPSLVEWVQIGHSPNPDSDPCVPCVSDGFNQSIVSEPKGAEMREVNFDLVLDLSESSAIRPFLTLQELYLRVEDDFYPLLLRTVPGHVARLDTLADGEVEGLVVRHARRLFSPDQQPSLLFVLCDQASDCFWTSVPVLAVE